MTRLILTVNDSSAGVLRRGGFADLVVPILHRFVWGPLPSDAELSAYLMQRTARQKMGHWLDFASRREVMVAGGRSQSFLELIDRCDSVELWMDTRPNDQLVLIWLLDYLCHHAEIATKIVLRHVDAPLFDGPAGQLAGRTIAGVELAREHLDLGHLAWQAFRSPTPQAWFDLLKQDLSTLPQLRRCVQEMLDELPGAATGLGASELRILELLSAGYQHPFDLLPHYRERFQRRVYDYWEAGTLLDSLALAPVPAISGLADWPFSVEMHDSRERLDRYKASTLSLTLLGKGILAGEEDFSSHNPIRRWWGGTKLTNACLWRWRAVLIAPDPDTPHVIECRELWRPIDWSMREAAYSAASA
ncbi:DUF1835 domain-containing protein [Bradyrhizobium ontarionense]|uniref:DUF1835 domain-containing protein n=1 Tax=Bradyrhizobium ontarionense TaxID=2898149 RepID=A0ABY3RC71_9BRAD|nr:DUF1835 domain-containing protein [Bradyrhizobium sp. A19]UFZ04587.1 DUF1835 domain-containing protein [Bradyrhizobium sp. A19]